MGGQIFYKQNSISNSQASIIAIGENRGQFKGTFLKKYCRDIIKWICYVGIKFKDDSRNYGQIYMNITQ